MPDNILLQLKNLSINYRIRDGVIKAVDNINLDIPKGKLTSVIGESGCGKSTIATAIMGSFAPNAFLGEKSEIIFEDKNLLNLPYEEVRNFRWHKASMVFQAAQNALNPTLRIRDQLLDVIYDHNMGLTKKLALKRVDEYLRKVYLDPERILKSYPHEISGGMRQRVIIAMALLLEPELLILDEPTTALDVITQYFIFDILQELHRDLGVTMVLITHDIELASKISDKVVVMYGGRIMEQGPSEKLFFDKDAGAKHPYTEGLLNSIPSITDTEFNVVPIPGFPPDLINKPEGCIFHPRCTKTLDYCAEKFPEMIEIGSDRCDLSGWTVACHLYKNEEVIDETDC